MGIDSFVSEELEHLVPIYTVEGFLDVYETDMRALAFISLYLCYELESQNLLCTAASFPETGLFV